MRLWVGAIVGVWLAMTSFAYAQDSDVEWQQGVQLRAAGRDAEALAHFQRMHAASGSARTLAQVAFAEQALGRWGAAALHLDQARANPDAWVQRRRQVVEQARAEIASHVGQVELLIEGDAVDVELDGVVVGRSPLPGPIPATAGTVALRLLRGGRPVAERSLRVQVGALTRESIRAPGSGGGGGTGGGGSGALTIVGGILLGVGGLAAIGLGVSWGLREAEAQRYNDDDECWNQVGRTRDQQCPDARDYVQNTEVAAIVLGVSAGVFFGLGLALVLADGGSDDRATLSCAPGLAGATCGGTF